MELIGYGFLLGLSIAAPIGPIGILCIQRSLTGGFCRGAISGLGAACADLIYGMIAVFGISSIAETLQKYQDILGVLGGIYLLYLGCKNWNSSEKRASKESYLKKENALREFGSTFFLTLTNPMTIFSFGVIFSALGINYSHIVELLFFLGGIFLGSAIWWIFLSAIASKVSKTLLEKYGVWINRFCGSILVIFGIICMYSVI